ncbi:hypothetical protein GCM10010300_26060 [Streptomyces olivaceoviridis]|nr:hypothetical protein GCM10010300_26060 [Streptomyces olivaceoviridis]
MLDGAGKAVVVVGDAGRPASRQAVEVVRLLGAGVATTALARDALPDALPYLAGVAGPLGSEAAATLPRECDTLLLAGAEDLGPAVLPGPGRCRIVTVDREPDDCPLEGGAPAVRVTGDVTACLEALAPLPRHTADRAWRTRAERLVGAWRDEGAARSRRCFGTSVAPARSSPSCRTGCPTGPSSPTPAPHWTGGPATSGCGPACGPCSRATSACPARPSPTPWRPGSPPPTGR